MSRRTVEVDPIILGQAADILGTTTLQATIDAALHEVVHARRRLELVAMFSQEGRFDFEGGAWGDDE